MSFKRGPWRLRTLLVGQFLAAMLVALVVLTLMMVFWRLPLVQQQTREEQARVADLALANMEQGLDNTQALVSALTGLADAAGGPAAAVAADTFAVATRQMLLGDNLLDGVYLLDHTLTLRTALLRHGVMARAGEWVGNDLSAVAVLRNARQQNTLQWSAQFLSPIQGKPVVAVAVPFAGGVLLGELSMDRLVSLTNRPNQRDGLLLLAVDNRGALVSAPNLRLVRERTNLMNLPLVQAALRGEQASGRFEFDGRAYEGSTRLSQRLGWGLLVAYPESVSQASRDAAILIAVVTLSLALAVGVAMAVWLARRIDRVVHGAMDFAQQMADGRYGGEPRGSGIVELQRLGTDLKRVAGAIAERERQLADQDRRFRELVERTADLVIELDRQGTVVYVNPAAEQALSQPGLAALGRPIVDLVVDSQRAMVQNFLEAGDKLRQPTYRQDLRMVGPGGALRDIAWSSSVDRSADGRFQGFRCIGIDVTSQRAAEAAVRRSEERLRTILNGTPTLAVQWFDAQGRVLEWNAASQGMFGWRRDEVLGRRLDELIYTPEQQRDFMQILAEVGRTGQPQGPYEGEVRDRAGRARWLLSTTIGVPGDAGPDDSPMIFVCLDVDISDRKRAEAALLELNAQLEERIEERTRSLSIANMELEQALKTVQLAQDRLVASQDRLVQSEKLASLGSLVAGVAHELNTPIGNGRMAVSTLKERAVQFRQQMAQGLKRSDLEAFVTQVDTGGEIASRNLERASELLSSFKQVAVDQTSDQRRRFRLREVVDEILLTLQPTFKRSTHELVCQVPETIELDSYPGALGQVLTNLVQNAHLHGLDGVDHGRIDICAEVRATEVCLSVADNGHGIPEANRRHVFDPFYTTKLGQGGSGLGLPIVRNIVAGALGGHIDFRNLDEGGVVFEVVIPLTAPAAHATEAAAV